MRASRRIERRPALDRQPRPEHQVPDVFHTSLHRTLSTQPFAGAQNSARNGYPPRNASNESLDLQRDALRAVGIDDATNLYHDRASGVRDDRPGLDSCLRDVGRA